MDTERVREALAKLKAEYFAKLEIEAFFEPPTLMGLADSASLQSCEKSAPSNSGTD